MNNLTEKKFPHSGTKTQKLASLIEVAMNAPALLPGRLLTYKISGDVIELHISGADINDEDLRLATINCGLVLSFLQKAIEDQHYVPVIQSFPNVSEPHLVAFIRIEKKNSMQGFRNRLPYVMEANIDDDGSNVLKKVITDENQFFCEITQGERVSQIIDNCQDMRVESNSRLLKEKNIWNLSIRCNNGRSTVKQDLKKLWMISTNTDNAISWLSVGKVLGKILLMCSDRLFHFYLDVNLLENLDFRRKTGKQFAARGYTQFLLKPTYYK